MAHAQATSTLLKSCDRNCLPPPTDRLAPDKLGEAHKRGGPVAHAGGVSWSVYRLFVRGAAPPLLALGLTALLVSPIIRLFSTLLLAQW